MGATSRFPKRWGRRGFTPFSDFLLHDVGTGDGIVMAMEEHYGPNAYKVTWKSFSLKEYRSTANKVRTAPLWGVRLRTRLMHDGASVTLRDATLRHRGEASRVTQRFQRLSRSEQEAIVEFLQSQ